MMKKMNRIFSALALLGAVATLAVGCQKEELAGVDNKEANVIYAAPPTSSQSKITFTEGEESGIDLAWEVGDKITLFKSDGGYKNYADMECMSVDDQGVAAFSLITTTEVSELDLYKNYRAVYPATNIATFDQATVGVDVPSEQNGDDMSQLKNTCLMESGTFHYDPVTEFKLEFTHRKAMMTFTFTSPDHTPAKLVFNYGDIETYTVTFTDAFKPDENDLYTASIMVNTNQASKERLFTYKLYEEDATDPYKTYTVTSTKNYKSGTRYIANLDNLVDGDGSVGNPYKISGEFALRKLASDVAEGAETAGKYYKMTQNINLRGFNGNGEPNIDNEFTPIGSEEHPFEGNFDGGNFTVSGLYINQPSKSEQALFGYVDGSTITNLTVSGTVNGDQTVAGVVGYANAAVISNCSNEVEADGEQYVGGVVGKAEGSSTIINCSNTGVIGYNDLTTDGTDCCGGVVGNADGQPVVNCYNRGRVLGLMIVGGVAGVGNCTSCYNTGNVNALNVRRVGGIASGGSAEDCFQLTGCVTSGSGVLDGTVKDKTYMQGLDFVTDLDNGAAGYNETKEADAPAACGWKNDSEGSAYPVLDYTKVPTKTE